MDNETIESFAKYRLNKAKETSDYDDDYEPSLEKTEQQINTAQELIELVETYINDYYKKI